MKSEFAIMVGAFAAGVLVAELFGAANLGTALGVGQITFLIATTYVIVRPTRGPADDRSHS